MTGQHNSSTGRNPGAVAAVITDVSLGVCVYPEGHAPLYRFCDRKLFYACAWNSGMHGAVRGPHWESHGFPRLRRSTQMTRESGAWRHLSASPGNAVQNRI